MSACAFVCVQLMILVDGAGGEWPVIGHAPWNGCNLADFVMPFFLFIVGMAIPLSLKVRSSCLTLLLYMPCLHQAMSLSTLCLDATTPSVKFEFNTDQETHIKFAPP
jgi:predicted acyltransferase